MYAKNAIQYCFVSIQIIFLDSISVHDTHANILQREKNENRNIHNVPKFHHLKLNK